MLHHTRREKLTRNKYSSFFSSFVSYEENEVLWIRPQVLNHWRWKESFMTTGSRKYPKLEEGNFGLPMDQFNPEPELIHSQYGPGYRVPSRYQFWTLFCYWMSLNSFVQLGFSSVLSLRAGWQKVQRLFQWTWHILSQFTTDLF